MDITKLLKLKNKKIAKMGEDHVVFIPRNYIRNELIDPKKRYNIYFEEAKDA